jgi:hypothetical protein
MAQFGDTAVRSAMSRFSSQNRLGKGIPDSKAVAIKCWFILG